MAIFKVFKQREWESFTQIGEFAGSADDQRDGFIHFSTESQLAGTLNKYYNQESLIIIACMKDGDEARSSYHKALKWEASRGGQLFPHLYAHLYMQDIKAHWHLEKNTSESWMLDKISANLNIDFAPSDI